MGIMIVLILQALKIKYFQDLRPGVSEGGASSFGNKCVAFEKSSKGEL